MASILRDLNPFSPLSNKRIRTQWGNLKPKVDTFPILYLLFVYGIIYVAPFGRDIVGMSWFDWLRAEDGPLEWAQFIFYLLSSIFAIIAFWKRRKSKNNRKVWWWS